ncbi:post-GPI attachment to proteins factor 6 isoform X5 [Marmota monax]|uniref:post-GPI attachment to proteins factor 6 isoform X5 n=1 Tax=Marmota monax TaxID=9995 RepID=UPI001EB0724C|nr:post-GPI attachment to proteins factor 6 isoform X5 [Marmota monax]
MGRAGTGGAARAAAVAGPPLLLLLMLLLLTRSPPATAGDHRKSVVGLVSEHFSQAPQKLSSYSWYGSIRLFHFRVPPDTVLLRWLLHVSWDSSTPCTDVEITMHFRHGAPPVINPLGTSFPNNTIQQPSFQVRALLTSMLLDNTSVNVSHPAPGDWFVAAHLPPSSQKIEVQGFAPTCAYVFQPDMLVMRAMEVSILEPDVPLPQTLLSHPNYLKIFVPEYTQELLLELQGCVSSGSPGCPVRLTVGGATLPSNFQKPMDGISVLVRSDAPSLLRLHLDTGMDSGGSLTITLRVNKTEVSGDTLVVACVNAASAFLSFNTSLNCTTAFFQGYPLSLRASSPVANLIIPYPETSSWYLSLQLLCPESPGVCEQTMVHVETVLYLVPCLNDCGPYGQCLLLRRYSYLYAGCSCKAVCTWVMVGIWNSEGFPLGALAPGTCLRPLNTAWPPGWRGWSCTDNSTAQTVAQQKVAALLLTLSNLMFLVPIMLSVQRAFLVEASVYFYTMFFSTFYHACDQPGEAVLCILSYDTLQYCDFLGSGVSTWVTILCMARLKTVLKHVLFLLGTLVIAMSLQLDRRGIWNMMGPCLFAFMIMAFMWVQRCRHRHQCYPTSWQRWAFCLLPGISMASMGVAIYTSMMTSDNYYYTHSIWHILLAGSAAFLLPPREEQTEPWACSQKFPCHYQICKNNQDELYTVT